MGVKAVVIVENSRHISLDEFGNGLKADKWGKYACNRHDNIVDAGREFEWKGKSYFSWIFTPRANYLALYDIDWDNVNYDLHNAVTLTFLKVMLVIERLAGGPIYVGNDFACQMLPEHAKLDGERFSLPSELDTMLHNWRDVDNIEIDTPQLVF